MSAPSTINDLLQQYSNLPSNISSNERMLRKAILRGQINRLTNSLTDSDFEDQIAVVTDLRDLDLVLGAGVRRFKWDIVQKYRLALMARLPLAPSRMSAIDMGAQPP